MRKTSYVSMFHLKGVVHQTLCSSFQCILLDRASEISSAWFVNDRQ